MAGCRCRGRWSADCMAVMGCDGRAAWRSALLSRQRRHARRSRWEERRGGRGLARRAPIGLTARRLPSRHKGQPTPDPPPGGGQPRKAHGFRTVCFESVTRLSHGDRGSWAPTLVARQRCVTFDQWHPAAGSTRRAVAPGECAGMPVVRVGLLSRNAAQERLFGARGGGCTQPGRLEEPYGAATTFFATPVESLSSIGQRSTISRLARVAGASGTVGKAG